MSCKFPLHIRCKFRLLVSRPLIKHTLSIINASQKYNSVYLPTVRSRFIDIFEMTWTEVVCPETLNEIIHYQCEYCDHLDRVVC